MNLRKEIHFIVSNIQIPHNRKAYTEQHDAVPIILMLSLFYAFCSQLIISLPFFMVPISVQPLPLFIAVEVFGWHATWAFILYYLQGLLGAPVFAYGGSGFIHITGATGGYLIGMFFAMVFLSFVRSIPSNSFLVLLGKLLVANGILYGVGLYQLSYFLPWEKVFIAGFYPFVVGDSIKMIVAGYCMYYCASVRPK